MARKTIAIDIDDVLANSTEAFRLVVNQHLGINLTPEDYRIEADYTRYYITVWQQQGIADKVNYSQFESGMIEDQSHIAPHTDAERTLQKLARQYRLVIVTSRPVSWRTATHQWIQRFFPDLFSEILFSEETGQSKGQLCKDHGASWLIDDNVDHALSAHQNGIEVILFGDYGWQHTVPDHFYRCKDWNAVWEYFDGRR